MTKPLSTLPNPVESDANLTSALAQIGAEVDNQPLRSSALARIMRETFHGSDAGGAWDWRMAYDLMQAAAVQVLLRGDGAAGDIAAAKLLASRLLTETRRSEQQIRLQQFSTPLPFAALVLRAAAIRKGETVLEPSAGTGALAAFAARAGATLLLNEIDPFRQSLLRAVFGGEVTGHDGEHIDDLLQTPVLPDVVVMNPPFASSVDRSRDKYIAAKHLIEAAKRLAPGGRLVAIMPPGFSPERDGAHWSRACGLLTPRLALTMPGQVYRKLGTSVETQLMVFDKVQDDGEMIRASVRDLDEALAYVDAVAATRPEMRPAQRGEAIPHARPTVRSSAPRKTVASPVAASKPWANAVRPLSFTSFETPRDNTPISDIYARYRPQRFEIAGAQEHPTPLVESIAMASVAPPVPSNTGSDDLRLPARLIEEGDLSEAQLETIVMAHDAHVCDLPGRFTIDDDQTKLTRADDDPNARAYRLGYFLGDGTGCGKGRECAGLILVNWLAGRRKAIWVSKSATLIEDAIRDWTDLGGSPADIQPLSKWKPDQPIPMGDGILFVTYATLRSAGKCGTTRLSQILDWMGEDFEGVLAFDEAHAMQNAAGSEQGRGAKPSQQGLTGLRLQLAAPRARVFYISATGATSVHNLAYAARLGLWGQGPEYPFPSRESFVSAMEAGGVAAMEVVARDLKTLGLYTARALSFDGVEYDVLEHALTPAQIEIYDAYAGAFRTIHHNLEAALTATGVNDASGETNASAARASAKSRFESTKQRFFNHLLMGMKAPSIIRAIKEDLAEGTFLESFAEGRARREMHDLLSRVPRTATRHRNGGLEEVPLDEIATGDRLLVRQGDVVPVDGTVASDTAFVDTSALTGESLPVRLAHGADAMSGSTNAGEAFELTATREAKDSTYAGIVRLVEEAQRSKAPMSRLADRWSLGFLFVTVTIAFAAWWFSGDPIRAVAVLVVATPCPLILAVPVALVAGLSRAAHFGVLIKGAGPLEAMARIRTLILDKTGTLTDGRPQIVSIDSHDGMTEDDILRFAAALDQASKHPVAQAIVAAAKARGLVLPIPSEVAEIPGEGVVGYVEGKKVIVGGDDFVAKRVGRVEGDHASLAEGSVLVAVAVDGHMSGHLVMADPLRDGTAAMLDGLRRQGIERILLATGDRAAVAERVTEGLGLDGLRAGLTPDQKVLLVLTERKNGPVMMVGDGVNDAPALAAADVGVAMGARGAAASAEAADVVLLVDRVDRLGPGIEIARRSRRIAVESVVAGIGLSVAGMIAAAYGYLSPVQGALLQEVIDVAVILNALRALRIKPEEPNGPDAATDAGSGSIKLKENVL